ncbi:paraquat-inducible protein A [Acinetobacter calcoaceticus]|uniref:Paraquat-inducible protein A n=1 Tax=Acinetobacter calcoaceticus TaxID=471 RepID=A0A4V2R0Z1_ACICA|nr:paraquat-inducible protein A [Acinetobacter calcoaceticus]
MSQSSLMRNASSKQNPQQNVLNGSSSPETLVGCEECDTVYQRVPLAEGERAYCLSCGGELYQRTRSLTSLLALVVTAMIVFIIANCFPIVIVELQGNSSQTTLLGAAWVMFQIDRAFVGFLILMTTFVVPLIDLLLLIYVLSSVGVFNSRPRYLVFAMRTLSVFRTWGMVEVFLIGVLVTLVKLVAMVVVIPGVALWAFAILSVLLVYIASFKVKSLWDEIDRSVP